MIFFETLKAFDGEVFHVPYHQERYESVLRYFGIAEALDISLHVRPPKDGLYRCRFVYDLTKEPHVVKASYHKYEKRVIRSLKVVHDDTIEYDMKSTCRDRVDALFAQREKCDDVLIIKNSLVTDTSIANIAFYDSKRWLTPASPLLKGTTRERLLREGMIYEEEIRLVDIERFEKAALMNAMVDFDIISKNMKELLCLRD